MQKIKLLGDKILLENIELSNTTKTGFILPENQKNEKLKTAKVIAVGNGSRNEDGDRIAMDIAVGDTVLYEYSSYATKEIEMENKKYYIVRENDIVGIL